MKIRGLTEDSSRKPSSSERQTTPKSHDGDENTSENGGDYEVKYEDEAAGGGRQDEEESLSESEVRESLGMVRHEDANDDDDDDDEEERRRQGQSENPMPLQEFMSALAEKNASEVAAAAKEQQQQRRQQHQQHQQPSSDGTSSVQFDDPSVLPALSQLAFGLSGLNSVQSGKKTCPYCFQQLSWHALSRHIRDMHRRVMFHYRGETSGTWKGCSLKVCTPLSFLASLYNEGVDGLIYIRLVR